MLTVKEISLKAMGLSTENSVICLTVSSLLFHFNCAKELHLIDNVSRAHICNDKPISAFQCVKISLQSVLTIGLKERSIGMINILQGIYDRTWLMLALSSTIALRMSALTTPDGLELYESQIWHYRSKIDLMHLICLVSSKKCHLPHLRNNT